MEIGPLKLVERVEQCGTRFTVSGPLPSGYWYIHDFPAADGTLANGADDFIAGAFPACEAVCVYGVINATCMEMWYDPSCTSSGAIEADGTVPQLGARRCRNPDGTVDFYNKNVAESTGGSPLVSSDMIRWFCALLESR